MLAKHRHENWVRFREVDRKALELQEENAALRARIEVLEEDEEVK